MWLIVIFIFIVFIAVVIGFSGSSLAKGDLEDYSQSDAALKKDLANNMDKLSKIPRTVRRSAGAMSYETPSSFNKAHYICPVCGEITLHNSKHEDDIDKIRLYRSLVKRIRKFDVKLDESQFCRKCSPNTNRPQFSLIVKYGQSTDPFKTSGITEDDINLLYEFSEGIKEHTANGETKPLKAHKYRLQELLGVQVKVVR